MADTFFKKDPKKAFFETDEPLDNTDPVEGKPFGFEGSSVHRPFGWYPFLYESPFTMARVGRLTTFTPTDDFGFPIFFPIPSGDVAPTGGGGVSHFTIQDAIDAAKAAFCDETVTGKLTEEDKTTGCENISSPCGFAEYLAALEALISAEDAAQQDDGTSCGKDTCNAGQFLGQEFANADWNQCGFTWKLFAADIGTGCSTLSDEGPDILLTLIKIADSDGTETTVCSKRMTSCAGTCAQRAIRVWTNEACGMLKCMLDAIATECGSSCTIPFTCTAGICSLD